MVSNPTKALLTEYACSGPLNGRLLLVVVVWDVGLDGADHKSDRCSDGLDAVLRELQLLLKHVTRVAVPAPAMPPNLQSKS